jgi:hypothetical protein
MLVVRRERRMGNPEWRFSLLPPPPQPALETAGLTDYTWDTSTTAYEHWLPCYTGRGHTYTLSVSG